MAERRGRACSEKKRAGSDSEKKEEVGLAFGEQWQGLREKGTGLTLEK